MRKYEENRYILEEIKDQIYPWVKGGAKMCMRC